MDARPKTNIATPTHTMPFKLASFALSSRAVSFCAAPNSVLARVSSRSTTGIGALTITAAPFVKPDSKRDPVGTV